MALLPGAWSDLSNPPVDRSGDHMDNSKGASMTTYKVKPMRLVGEPETAMSFCVYAELSPGSSCQEIACRCSSEMTANRIAAALNRLEADQHRGE